MVVVVAERKNRNLAVVVEEGNNRNVVAVVEKNNRNVVAVVVMEGNNRNVHVVMEVERKLQKCDGGGKTIEMWHEAVLKKKVESGVDMRSIFLWMENI